MAADQQSTEKRRRSKRGVHEVERIEFRSVGLDPVAEHESLRRQIEQDTAKFLESGKQIQVIPFGKSGEQGLPPIKSQHSAKIEIDITGQKFGTLTAIRRCQTRDMASFWVFVCDCGYQGTFERKKVMDGPRSCCDTCKKQNEKPKPRTPDITGQRFGQLTVMHKAEQTLKSGTQWVCKCDCGAVLKNRYFDLVNGRLKRCGRCRHKEEKSKRGRKYEAENAKRAHNKSQRSERSKTNREAHARPD